jgi:hypothetical protein
MAGNASEAVERLVATEALYRMAAHNEEGRQVLLRRLEAEEQPSVLKNLILILPHAGVLDWQLIAERVIRRCSHPIVADSYAWTLAHPCENLLEIPDLEPPYTRKTVYPDLELYPAYFDASC